MKNSAGKINAAKKYFEHVVANHGWEGFIKSYSSKWDQFEYLGKHEITSSKFHIFCEENGIALRSGRKIRTTTYNLGCQANTYFQHSGYTLLDLENYSKIIAMGYKTTLQAVHTVFRHKKITYKVDND